MNSRNLFMDNRKTGLETCVTLTNFLSPISCFVLQVKMGRVVLYWKFGTKFGLSFSSLLKNKLGEVKN